MCDANFKTAWDHHLNLKMPIQCIFSTYIAFYSTSTRLFVALTAKWVSYLFKACSVVRSQQDPVPLSPQGGKIALPVASRRSSISSCTAGRGCARLTEPRTAAGKGHSLLCQGWRWSHWTEAGHPMPYFHMSPLFSLPLMASCVEDNSRKDGFYFSHLCMPICPQHNTGRTTKKKD